MRLTAASLWLIALLVLVGCDTAMETPANDILQPLGPQPTWVTRHG